MNRKLEIINTLIEAGCLLNSCDMYNWSPIHVAAKQTDQITPNQTLLEWIIEKNQSLPPERQFDLEKRGGMKAWTPLHVACYQGNVEAV
jgi:ankyrin repeat protein